MGAGWFENEHGPFGIDLPPIGERIDRLISAVEVIRLLFSPEAATPPGVTRDDPFYPLAGATNLPGPLTPGGPPIFLGGQKPRGIRLAARRARGLAAHRDRRGRRRDVHGEARRAHPRARGRGPRPGHVRARRPGAHGPRGGATARGRWTQARALAGAGATEIVVGVPAALGPAALEAAHRDVLLPLRAEHG